MADIDSSLPVMSEVDPDSRVQVKVVDATTPSQQMEVDTDNDAHVKAKLRDDSGAAFGIESNPVYVTAAEQTGTKIVDYNTSAAVASDATANHDYTVSASTEFRGVRLITSASGEFKVEVQLETAPAAGTYNTIYVGFAQASSPFLDIPMDKLVEQVAGAIIRVSITNRENQAQDVYSTLTGLEVAI